MEEWYICNKYSIYATIVYGWRITLYLGEQQWEQQVKQQVKLVCAIRIRHIYTHICIRVYTKMKRIHIYIYIYIYIYTYIKIFDIIL